MLKTFVSEAFGRILDRALQVYGGAGMTHDHPIAQWYADARAARIYDGASEVHRMSIARKMLRAHPAGRVHRARLRRCCDGRPDRTRRRRPPPSRTSTAAARRCLMLDPLVEFLDAHGLGRGRAGDRAARRRALQPHLRRHPRRSQLRPAPPAARPPYRQVGAQRAARGAPAARAGGTGARVPQVAGRRRGRDGDRRAVLRLGDGRGHGVHAQDRRRRSTTPSSMCGSPTSSSTRWSRSTTSIGGPPGWRTFGKPSRLRGAPGAPFLGPARASTAVARSPRWIA